MCALLAVLVPAIAAFAQDEASPARRHAQVIAHGVMTMPAGEVAWRLGTRQALPADRVAPEPRAAGFVVAGENPLLLSDAAGEVEARLGPGEAVWTDAGEKRAVVGAAGRGDYLEIALVAAQAPAERDDVATTAAFAVPAGAAFDVDLIRDVLRRGEESVIPASPAPMLLVVTSGTVFVDNGGALAEISAGAFVQVTGDVVVSGASRAPASFVVARIGARVEPRVTLRVESATPAASRAATPIAALPAVVPRQASVAVDAFFCPAGYAKSDYATVCRDPASAVAFSIERRGKTVQSRLTDDDGRAAFAEVKAGSATLVAGLPAGAATSDIGCRAGSGPEYSASSASNQISLLLVSGDDLDCTWYIIPADEHLTQSSLSVAIRACPEGMTAARFRPQACATMQSGTALTLRDGEDSKSLAAAVARADRWRWDGLARRAYTLDVDAFPEGFSDAALDTMPCCGAEHDFTVVMPGDRRRVTRTLYLFPPEVTRDRALTISIRACPPGMSAETLVGESCVPAPPGTTLTLQEHGIDVGVAAAGSDAWQWNGLGALPYVLRVNAVPAGFATYQLDDVPCCERDEEFPLDLATGPEQAERTLYLFQPVAAGEEGDADDDGLLDAREAELGTQPFVADSDGDGLSDGDEVDFYGSDPLNRDTDDDSLDDTEEVETRGTNPLLADTDGDGLPDAQELAAGSDPLDVTSIPVTPMAIPTATSLPTPAPLPQATPAPVATPEGDVCTACVADVAYDPA